VHCRRGSIDGKSHFRILSNPDRAFARRSDYAEEHGVLPDEYDTIHRDLEPYWGLSPADFRALESEQEAHADNWKMGKTGLHGVMLVNMTLAGPTTEMHLSVAHEILDTLKPIEAHLLHFSANFNPYDNPYITASDEFREQARTAVRDGTCKSEGSLIAHELILFLDLDLKNLKTENARRMSACTKSSPARTQPYNLELYPPPPSNKTFIHDHFAAMDPCQHPTLLHQHGQFLSHETGEGPPVPQSPVFSYSSSPMHGDMHIATPFNWVEDLPGDPVWAERRDDRLLWRGTNTGIWHAPSMRFWRQSHRERLFGLGDRLRGNMDVLVGGYRDEGFEVRSDSLKRLNGALLDLEFAGDGPQGCEESACEEMRDLFEYVPNMDWRGAGDYKYVMDVCTSKTPFVCTHADVGTD
jgi:hypothetical protein